MVRAKAARRAVVQAAAVPESPWRNRLVGYGEEAPDQLLAHPKNWRIHPTGQQAALEAVLAQVGLVDGIIVNKRTGHVLDGHLRVRLALRAGVPTLPVKYVDLDEQEELAVLATFDPIGAMAATDAALLSEVLDRSNLDPTLLDALHGIGSSGIVEPGTVDEQGHLDQVKRMTCPKCGYALT